jgi:hypothetical protein
MNAQSELQKRLVCQTPMPITTVALGAEESNKAHAFQSFSPKKGVQYISQSLLTKQ